MFAIWRTWAAIIQLSEGSFSTNTRRLPGFGNFRHIRMDVEYNPMVPYWNSGGLGNIWILHNQYQRCCIRRNRFNGERRINVFKISPETGRDHLSLLKCHACKLHIFDVVFYHLPLERKGPEFTSQSLCSHNIHASLTSTLVYQLWF